jgi:hypothetical protein
MKNVIMKISETEYIKKEYFSNNKIEAYYKKTYYNNDKLDRRNGPAVTCYYECGKISWEQYWINGEQHRLDGPANITYNLAGERVFEEYWVNNIYLYNFEKYCPSKIFKYIKKYPHHLKEVEILARHNKWLNEKDLELLSCQDLFCRK